MEVFAVNEAGELIIAPGEEGELWARGPCVAQGYWGDVRRLRECLCRIRTRRLYPKSPTVQVTLSCLPKTAGTGSTSAGGII